MKGSPTTCATPGAARNQPRTLRRWVYRTGLIGLLLIGLAILTYAFVNYRAERAWQTLQGALMAQGQRFDPDAFTLPPVPDARNFLKAPLIQDWFAVSGLAPGTSPTGRIITITRPGDVNLLGAWSERRPTALKEWRDHFWPDRSKPVDEAGIAFETPEVSLDVEQPVADPRNATLPAGNAPDELVLLIAIDDVPLADALRNLARQAQLDVFFDDSLFEMALQDTPLMQAPVRIRFENVTVRETLEHVLDNYGLALLETATPGRVQITRALASALARERMPAAPLRSAQEVLESFSQFADGVRALYAACERPQSRIEMDFRRLLDAQPLEFNFIPYRQVAQALTLHASAHLALRNSPAAFQDATALFRLAGTLRGQPNLVSAMVQVSLTGLYLQVVWEGLASRRWDDRQLALLEAQLGSFNLLADCFVGFEAEQAARSWRLDHTPQREVARELVEQLAGSAAPGRTKPMWTKPLEWALSWGPRGWVRQMQIGYTKAFQDYLGQLDFWHQRVHPSKVPAPNILRDLPRDGFMPLATIVHHHGLNFVKAVEVTARQQTAVNQARIACALERYRLARGNYPYELASLATPFIGWVPHDLITGQPMKYRPTEDRQFVLYSVGWDEKDDAAGATDWVWRYPDR